MYKKSIITVCLLLFIVFASNTFSIAQDARTLVKAGINTKYLLKKIFKIDAGEILSPDKHPKRVKARSVLAYWYVRELCISGTSAGKRLGMSQSAVSRAVQRGEKLVK